MAAIMHQKRFMAELPRPSGKAHAGVPTAQLAWLGTRETKLL